MLCRQIEELLSEHLESSLPASDMDLVGKHLNACRNCSALLDAMRSAITLCRNFPALEMDADLTEKILLRTSGRPRTRPFREILTVYFLRPLFTPRFAAGAALAALFLVLVANIALPRILSIMTSLSPSSALGFMDRSVQMVYSEGLKVYQKKDDLQAQLNYFKDNLINKLRFMMEKLDVPMEGRRESVAPGPRKDTTPNGKSSSLRLPPA